jgi:hypothetical protein
MDHHVTWVEDLKAPLEACEREHAGVPLLVSADDVARAAAEMKKGLHDVVFNAILVSPTDGKVHYVLGSIA